jgi:beta-1,2-mannobiose phosphorylase / 1,2-beta-oligomannan phosphorylase
MSRIIAFRCEQNPILSPDPSLLWQARAVFNASVLKHGKYLKLLYRAEGQEQEYEGLTRRLSTIGYAEASDACEIKTTRQFIVPSESWDKHGCEDPRVTKIDDQYLIFYTGLSSFPPDASSIKIGLALTQDFKKITAKHLVTPFNAKAMVLFPEKIGGKYLAFLTVHTDQPPANIVYIAFDTLEQIWDQAYWQKWYSHYQDYILPIERLNTDHIEIGAVPVKTDDGWILVYSHIQNYQDPDERIFGIEALLLDLQDPTRIIGRTEEPFLTPQLEYETKGIIPNVIFPSGAIIEKDELWVFYGGADTVVAMAKIRLESLKSYLKQSSYQAIPKFKRYHKNPIIKPTEAEPWRGQAVFNSAAIYAGDRFHLLYRAMSHDNTSTIGYASSQDGFKFDVIAHEPAYIPRMEFEHKTAENGFSGCEDPRLTYLDGKFYMFYTAYNGANPPQVALTSIEEDDFLKNRWIWSEPILISDPTTDNKNACLFPKKIYKKYVILHRALGNDIAIDLVDNLDFKEGSWLEKEGAISPRPGSWDSAKIGIAGPPHETEAGWLLIYHGVSQFDKNYRLGYILLDRDDPFKVLYRSPYPILEPVETWEKDGIVNNVVFSCGSILKDNQIFLYYGGADKVMAVATLPLQDLLQNAL